MNLPFIFDIVIGLTFIYLILSLLAAEIQEFITTIFQWRAKHLREAIEILMAGGKTDSSKTEIQQAIQLADQLYQNPLIENINQSAKGWLENIPRRFIWTIGDFYRFLKRKTLNLNSKISERTSGKDVKFLSKESQRTVFGDSRRSGPSYIPSDTFATTLMETLQIPVSL